MFPLNQSSSACSCSSPLCLLASELIVSGNGRFALVDVVLPLLDILIEMDDAGDRIGRMNERRRVVESRRRTEGRKDMHYWGAKVGVGGKGREPKVSSRSSAGQRSR